MTKGKFIVFEGLDGSGKTVQAQKCYRYLKQKGVKVILTKEPTDRGLIGILIRQVLQKKIKLQSADGFQLLYCADRAEHLEKIIKPALQKGTWVICDRYYYSTIAYGYLTSTQTRDWLAVINKKFLRPDKTLFFKVDPKICLQRIDRAREKKEFFEEADKLKKIWTGYQWCVAQFKETRVLDGEKTIEQIAERVKKEINKMLK
ncbi:MAG: dTMP kinase [Candidatus Portnoybacteria bacterium CG10_big_fil_rev_8_21_14_0_10_44_7]|uniref:Thymidylate kinase n=1 Tax=Candidatus Portnoybacteria bacterium CG10_big_fil_rev_8_21_14_0_10_44_7 TaxID=1974816 RepID=A0A2M8KIW6_9BACT|nr:MAG: dTMP kinase [Candidatus Portnoybacteria bacterium CG10_big_fil_rev_8_21_14_0_10_44_7]